MTTAEKIAPTIQPEIASLNGLRELYQALAAIFEHPWTFRISHVLDGLPSFIVEVHSPSEDPFLYDERVVAVIEERFMPPGYFYDGTSVMTGSHPDGSTSREYYIYPKKRTTP